MLRLNLIAGSLFGMIAVLGAPIFGERVAAKFNADLAEKATPMPGRIYPNGEQGSETMEISAIDRQESERRLARYQSGIQYLFYSALALIGLGASNGGVRCQRVGGTAFVFGSVIYSGGLSIGALLSEPTLAVLMPVGGMLLLIGWGTLLVASIQAGGRTVQPA
ncbi:DUF423 domain-containing protein [Blastopirellula marina]|uniref:Uncharacterized protein n=1 Tax=Blastopirellula marina DSM 3645 TaxID=314230 RepID=A4A0T9_9BACT|nr:DUF423 domain-containing protein [Blastopirellula marina]EAQ77616.1 hypothetical protein DSM3645_24862 [Blastopirellula marina DSM 3645]